MARGLHTQWDMRPSDHRLFLLFITVIGCTNNSEPQTLDSPGGLDKSDHVSRCEPSRLMLVLDQSSSMETGTINGQTKWDIAVNAIDAVTSRFESNLETGLMTFPAGGQCSPGALLVEPQLNSRDAIAGNLTQAPPPSGNWTPMAQTLAALQEEPSMQASAGDRYAILITDGWQWCSPYDPSTRFDAVERVQQLLDMGVTTYVVGFGASVDAVALNLMAVTAGTDRADCDPNGDSPDAPNPCYYQADSPFQLQGALEEIVVTVTAEECDGIDNDCDGEIDEDLTRACSTNCGDGIEVCTDGNWQGCDAPAEEPDICDGKDNDCDGHTDPGCACQPGDIENCGETSTVGECHPGTKTCDSDGQWGECIGSVGPAEEICNDRDDDCDGIVDNPDEEETCDGKDNDCDGEVDEELTRACSTACGIGRETCHDGDWVDCDAPEVTEDICDGKDNDCDGTADNGCDCIPGDTLACGTSDEGECKLGSQVCDKDGQWGECQGATEPTTEICDGKDNDCDGEVDESNGLESPSGNDDVRVICPQGDDQPEQPQVSEDPQPVPDEQIPKGEVTGCGCASSSNGDRGTSFFALALGVWCFLSRARSSSKRS